VKEETLSTRVARAKARWLQRVMYHSKATPFQKCFAYLVFDYLNCVTLDAWPAQATIAQRLGCKCNRTVQRAARGLATLELLAVRRNEVGKSEYKYAPHLDCEEDVSVTNSGQQRQKSGDTGVNQSSLSIHTISDSTGLSAKSTDKPKFDNRQRGALEIAVAKLLGPDGLDILARLSAIDDRAVMRLCWAYAEGLLGERELAAARLAVERR
jgi:hypothetical protein